MLPFRQDTNPSILNQRIVSAVTEQRSTTRAKTAPINTETSIAAQILSRAYHTVDEVIADVEKACTAHKSSTASFDSKMNGSLPTPPSNDDCQDSSQVLAFKQELKDILRRELIRRPKSSSLLQKSSGDQFASNIKTNSESSRSASSGNAEKIGKSVLTLYGSAPTPKQLFSSLQQPFPAKTPNESINGSTPSIRADLIHQPLRESALPTGISTTRIIPVHSVNSSDGLERATTLGEAFPTPPNIPPLNPPKQSRHTLTRSQSVSWYSPSDISMISRSRGRESYTAQTLYSGQWLTYNVAPSTAQLASPGEKRKQRDRALSFGEAKPSIPLETVLAHQQAKEDALFKSAYSSFAPDHDDSAAVIPQDVKNRLWWDRFCESKYNAYEGLVDEDDLLTELGDSDDVKTDEISEEGLFREAVETWTPVEVPPDLVKENDSSKGEDHDKTVDEILADISDLIETMIAYQRARNLSLSATARTTGGQSTQLTAMTGSPTTPSSTEFDIYDMLKSQLSLMISALPPYAVAKLDGDQLGALNISTRLPTVSKNYRGTTEEFEVLKARPTAVSTPTAPLAHTAAARPSIPARNSYYQQTASTPAQRINYTSRPSAPSATYPSQYSGRPATSSQSTSYSTYATHPAQPSTTRSAYSASQYGQQSPQAHTQQHTNGHRQYPMQNGYSSYSQQYGGTPSGTSTTPGQANQYQRPSQPVYQQRAQNSQSYSYGAVPPGRSVSPANPSPSYSSQPQSRSSYATPAQGPGRSQHYQAPPSSQLGTVNANAVQVNGTVGAIGTVGTVGQHIHLSAEEQAMLMSRQKAQLAQQMAMNSPRQGSGTPQPPGMSSGGPSDGVMAPQQNGVVAEKV